MSSIAQVSELKKLLSKYGTTKGILALGSRDGTETGDFKALRTDANGRLEVSVVSSGSSYNPEDDDGAVPAGENRETVINLLHGYDESGGSWQRVKTDGSGKLLVYTP